MSVQYSGTTIINTTLTQSTGTRLELCDWIKGQLTAAGWTVAAGSSGNWRLNSLTTPSGLNMAVNPLDPGSGNCTQVKVMNQSQSHSQSGAHFLLPAVSKQWRCIASGYQFAVFTPGASAVREFLFAGVPYLPAGSGVTEAIHSHSNATTDVDSVAKLSFRTSPQTSTNGTVQNGQQFCVLNGIAYEQNNVSGGGSGNIHLVARFASAPDTWGNVQCSASRWYNNDFFADEPLIAWSTTSDHSGEGKVIGQLWDAVVFSGMWSYDVLRGYDGHNYFSLMGANNGVDSYQPRCGLFLVVP
jgi:hypothetical protein